MSGKNKNYNSIIFLTTLSVYLGLSLLGATPQVLAYAATTRNFDIQNEIEFKDDLDTKPDGEIENQAEDFPRKFAELFAEIIRYSNERNLKTSFFETFQSQSFVEHFIVFGNAGNRANGISESINPFAQICDRFIYSDILPNALKIAGYKNLYNSGTHIGEIKEVQAKVKADKSNLVFEVSFSRSKSDIFADYLKAKYISLKKNAQETRLKKFYENTKINSENNQVFIVTRLPRAAIDSLIK